MIENSIDVLKGGIDLSSPNVGYELDSVLISRDAIRDKVEQIAGTIASRFRGETVVFTGILKGASIFMSDLVRAVGIGVDVRMDFMAVSSYGDSQESSGVVKIIKDMDTLAEGKNIVIVEDIVDTGFTLDYLRGVITARGPKSLGTCVLLEKPDRHKTECSIDYKGFTIPDKFVVGYGLDYAGMWRNLPEIWTLKKVS